MGWLVAGRCFTPRRTSSSLFPDRSRWSSRDCEVRLERPYRSEGRSRRLDIWLPEKSVAVELKYFTRRLRVNVSDERYDLKDHAATDLARHGFLSDVQRLEELVRDGGSRVRLDSRSF